MVELSRFPEPAELDGILKKTPKLQAFNRYCASDLQILGILELSETQRR